MRRGVGAALALGVALACPSAALADQTVQAVDGTATDGSDNRWSPDVVTVKVGETVTWNFGGTALVHNVMAAGTNWSFRNDPAVAGPPISNTFTTPGTYEFFCQLHAAPMRGTVKVTDETGAPPPPPPPPPLSEQPFANDQATPAVFELRDTQAPTLTRVAASRVKRGARIRFRLSEAGRATLKLTRGGRTVRSASVDARRGANTIVVRGLRAGSYRVELRAWDLAGNLARAHRARVTVRS